MSNPEDRRFQESLKPSDTAAAEPRSAHTGYAPSASADESRTAAPPNAVHRHAVRLHGLLSALTSPEHHTHEQPHPVNRPYDTENTDSSRDDVYPDLPGHSSPFPAAVPHPSPAVLELRESYFFRLRTAHTVPAKKAALYHRGRFLYKYPAEADD